MRWDRWVLPPAVSAALFAALAISPPLGSRPASVHRLESLGDPVVGRPWLLRARLTADATTPTSLRVGSPDAAVAVTTSRREWGSWYRVAVPAGARTLRLRISDRAGDHPIRAIVRAPGPLSVAWFLDERAMAVEGTLVPEVTADVLVRSADGPVALVPVTDQVAVEPAQQALDACGLASFRVRVSGLGAPVSLVSPTRRDELRLPLVADGIAVRDDVDTIVLRATSAGALAHLVGGDRTGATWWTAALLTADGDEGSARVVLPADTQWVVASRSADLSAPVSPLIRPSGVPCLATALGRRVARGRLAPPLLPPIRVWWDGPAETRHLTGQRMWRARALCVGGLAASIALEVLLLLGAGLARGPAALQPLAGDRRSHVSVLAAGVATLLLMGAALALAVELRGP